MIELKHLSKSFETAGGRVDALKDVSLTIEDGDIYGIIGMSGAGSLVVGKNIIAVSGATVSTKGINMGANAALAVAELLG